MIMLVKRDLDLTQPVPGTGPHNADCSADAPRHGYLGDKEALLTRLRRIEGQARGLHRMVSDESYCIDILTQVSAMKSALESVALSLLTDHLNHCVVRAAQAGGEEADEKMAEAIAAITRLIKS